MSDLDFPVVLETPDWHREAQGVDLAQFRFIIQGEQKSPFHMAEFTVAPGSATVLEAHQFRETWYVLAGTGLMRSGSYNRPIAGGDVIYIESHIPHQAENTGSEPFRAIAIWW